MQTYERVREAKTFIAQTKRFIHGSKEEIKRLAGHCLQKRLLMTLRREIFSFFFLRQAKLSRCELSLVELNRVRRVKKEENDFQSNRKFLAFRFPLDFFFPAMKSFATFSQERNEAASCLVFSIVSTFLHEKMCNRFITFFSPRTTMENCSIVVVSIVHARAQIT